MALSLDAILSAVELSLYGHNIARIRNNDIKQQEKEENQINRMGWHPALGMDEGGWLFVM